MQKSYIIALTVLVIVLLSLAAYSIQIFGSRTQTTNSTEVIVTKPLPDDNCADRDRIPPTPAEQARESTAELPSDDITEVPATPDEDSSPDTLLPSEKKSAFHITRENCANECVDFTENTSPHRYCTQICGIIPTQEEVVDCSEKSGLSRDYCLQDTALQSGQPELCDTISDKGLWKQCHTQIIENTIDGF